MQTRDAGSQPGSGWEPAYGKKPKVYKNYFIDLRHRDGSETVFTLRNRHDWSHHGLPTDITAWRLSPPDAPFPKTNSRKEP